MRPREAIELGEERRQENQEALVERLCDRETAGNEQPDGVLLLGRDAQAGMVQVEPAP